MYSSETKRTSTGNNYHVFYREHAQTGKKELVLDLAKVKQVRDPSTTIIDKVKMSDDHSRVAFNVDLHNNEKLSMGVMDIQTGQVLDWVDNCCQVEFDSTGEYIYYCVADKLNRPHKIFKRKIGDSQPQLKDTVIHEDEDPTHYIDIGVSKDKKYFIHTCGQGSVTVIDRSSPSGQQFKL